MSLTEFGFVQSFPDKAKASPSRGLAIQSFFGCKNTMVNGAFFVCSQTSDHSAVSTI